MPKATPVVQTTKNFEDPAILSMGKRPTPVNRPNSQEQWSSTTMERTISSRTATGREERVLKDITPAATLVEPMRNIGIVGDLPDGSGLGLMAEELEVEADISPEAHGPKGRRTRRRKGRKATDELAQDPAITPAKETSKSKGWRQTPLLEPNPSFQPFSTLKKKNGRRNGRAEENGWATEDATDVQDMGDFDFAGNLSKFDKHTVFSQIQAEDSVAEEDRLVAHNRLPRAKAGTGSGKNLHYTENVLDVVDGVKKADPWKSEAGESELEERASQRDTGSGRHSRRAESKFSTTRRSISRKGSANIQPSRTLSVSQTKFCYYSIADSHVGPSLRTDLSPPNAEPRKYRG